MSRVYTPPNRNSDPDDVVWTRNCADFANLRQMRRSSDGRLYAVRSRDIAIFIDGACMGNGTYHARAGMGVYFGPGSKYNISQQLYDNPQTNQRAELNAAILALQKVLDLVEYGWLETGNVVLISDSNYVVQAMTEWVYKWRNNGWTNHRGLEVTNRDDFERLDDLIDILDDEHDVSVRFWLVPRQYNQEADELAKDAADY